MKKVKAKKIKLVYIGRDFYLRSGTWMGSMYSAEDGSRYDWGKVEIALASGREVILCPATPKQLQEAEQKLVQINKEAKRICGR